MANVKPVHSYNLWFKKSRKRYRVGFKIFANNTDLNTHYENEVSKKYVNKCGIRAACIFSSYDKNKRFLGEMVFCRQELHPGLVAHEVSHIIMRLYRMTSKVSYQSATKEEDFVTCVEHLTDAVYTALKKEKIKFNLLPRYS